MLTVNLTVEPHQKLKYAVNVFCVPKIAWLKIENDYFKLTCLHFLWREFKLRKEKVMGKSWLEGRSFSDFPGLTEGNGNSKPISMDMTGTESVTCFCNPRRFSGADRSFRFRKRSEWRYPSVCSEASTCLKSWLSLVTPIWKSNFSSFYKLFHAYFKVWFCLNNN